MLCYFENILKFWDETKDKHDLLSGWNAYDQIMQKTLVPIQSLELSSIEPRYYLDGGLLGTAGNGRGDIIVIWFKH